MLECGLATLLQVGLISLSLASPQTAGVLRVRESALRKRATRVETPRFPGDALKRGSNGVAVVSIEVGESGRVTSVQVLQAPDSAISNAVSEAIYKWTFKPVTHEGKPVRLIGKLTFYFLLKHGKPRVESPKFD